MCPLTNVILKIFQVSKQTAHVVDGRNPPVFQIAISLQQLQLRICVPLDQGMSQLVPGGEGVEAKCRALCEEQTEQPQHGERSWDGEKKWLQGWRVLHVLHLLHSIHIQNVKLNIEDSNQS